MSDGELERRLEALQRENDALRRANAKLMRERIGRSNTGPGAAMRRARSRPGPVRGSLARGRLELRRILLRLLR